MRKKVQSHQTKEEGTRGRKILSIEERTLQRKRKKFFQIWSVWVEIKHKKMSTFSGDEMDPFFGFLDAATTLVFSYMGVSYGTTKSGVGVASMGVMRLELVMKSIVPAVMARVLGIYGLIIVVIISTDGAHKIPHIFLGDSLLWGGNGG